MFTAQVAYSADNFLEEHASVAGRPAHGSDATLVGKQFGPLPCGVASGACGMGSVWLAERADGLFKVALKLVHNRAREPGDGGAVRPRARDPREPEPSNIARL